MSNHVQQPKPDLTTDGTADVTIVSPPTPFGDGGLLELHWPDEAETCVTARYLLVRCGVDSAADRLTNWHFALRRPLYGVRARPLEDGTSVWQVMLPQSRHPAYRWLADREAGSRINVIGPLGSGITLGPETRNLLLIADAERIMKIAGLADTILDRGGRVTLAVLEHSADRIRSALLAQLPIAAEVHFLTATADWVSQVSELVRWADQLCAALPTAHLPDLAGAVRAARLRQQEGFARIFPDSDLVCGSGACLACVVPTAGGGLTRTCVHGPILDLVRLATG